MNTENPTQIKKAERGRRLNRVYRGGFWFDIPSGMRASFRLYTTPTNRGSYYGFRLVRNR
jgi:formylglycine-generating enzyme required for sulfatase activity